MPSSEMPPDQWDLFEEIGEDGDAEPQHDCDCWRLTRVLDPDEELPDHVCVETARFTTQQWAQYQVGKLVGHMSLSDFSVAVESTDGEAAKFPLDRVVERECAVWPLPYDGRHIGFVINQWTEGTPSKKFANQLTGDRRWQHEARSMRQLYEFLASARSDEALADVSEFVARASNDGGRDGTAGAHPPDKAFTDEWLEKAGWSASSAGLFGDDMRTVEELSDRLRQQGLPYNPSVLRHLRAVAAGMDEPLPAPGVLVTSIIYVGVDEDGAIWCRQNPEVMVVGSETAGPATSLRDAQPVVRRHREFVERFATHPFSDLSAIRRAQMSPAAERRGPGEANIDYAAEACDNLDELLEIARQYEDDHVGAIEAFLNRVQRRVANRRRRRNVPVTPEVNWRTKLYPVLSQYLREHH